MDDRARAAQRLFEWPVTAAALLVIPVIGIEQSSVGEPWDTTAFLLNWLIWLVFAAELVVMLALVPDRRAWLRRNPLDLPLVVLTPPVLPPGLQALRALRLLRLLRLLRVAKTARRVFSANGVYYAAVVSLGVAVMGGAAFAAFERDQEPPPEFFDGLWWAVTTMTTVGYGDVAPETTLGRLLAMALMAVGIGFVAFMTGAVAERFVSTSLGDEPSRPEDEPADVEGEIRREIAEVRSRLDRLEALLRSRPAGAGYATPAGSKSTSSR